MPTAQSLALVFEGVGWLGYRWQGIRKMHPLQDLGWLE